MFVCPYCGANARTRTSRRLSEFTIRQYHQCQNLECSESFTTLNTVERRVTKRAQPAPILCRQDLSPATLSRLLITGTVNLVLRYKNSPLKRGLILVNVVDMWTLIEINPFISIY